MKISVIIPCRNSVDTVDAQLEALAKQNWEGAYEVIVSDNDSTDGTVAVVEKFKNRFPDLRIVDASAKKGAGHARNVGAKAASGDVLLFCDADDVVGDGWIAAMAKALTQNDFVAGRLKLWNSNGSNALKGRSIPQNNGLQKYDYPDFLPHAASANLGNRRKIHELVGGFDESWLRLMDTDYCWRIQLMGTKMCFEPGAVVYMGMRSTWAAALKQSWLWGKYNVLLYKRYRSKGMPELNWKRGVNNWIRLGLSLPRIRSRLMFEVWMWEMAWNLGRLEGCVKYHVLAI